MKGSKQAKKNPIKKTSRKQTRTYMGNYDSRKEKITQSQASNKIKVKGEEENNKMGSDYVNSEKTSGFFKKRDKGRLKKKKSPLVYKEITELRAKGGFLSKTDDLRFLKDLGKEKKERERRGSSAYTKEKIRMVQSSHNSKNLKEDMLSSQNNSEINDEIEISRSLVVKKRESRRENKSDIEYIKQKYFGKGSENVS
jgi:hypothetical protein